MPRAFFEVVPQGDGWTVVHDGRVSIAYATREAAFEAAVGPASMAIRQGFEVKIDVQQPPSSQDG